jgi:hypothetical protein
MSKEIADTPKAEVFPKGVKKPTKETKPTDLGGYALGNHDPESDKFAGRHAVEKHGDRAGNDDKLFKASIVKKALDDSKNKRLAGHGSKEKDVYEAENLDELSDATLKSYSKKANAEFDTELKHQGGWNGLRHGTRSYNTVLKRGDGLDKASKKLATHDGNETVHEAESLDEKSIHIKRPGALTTKAKKAGEGVQEYANQHKHDGGLTGKQANFAINARKWHHESEDIEDVGSCAKCDKNNCTCDGNGSKKGKLLLGDKLREGTIQERITYAALMALAEKKT